MAYRPTSQKLGGIRILFLRTFTLGLCSLFSFGLKIFANTNSRFSRLLPPREPLVSDDHLIHLKVPTILSDKFPRPYMPIALQFSTTDKSVWITTHPCCSYLRIQLFSCGYKVPRNTLWCLDNSLQPMALEILLTCLPCGKFSMSTILHWHHLSLPILILLNHHECEYMHSSVDPCEFILPAQTSFQTWAGSR